MNIRETHGRHMTRSTRHPWLDRFGWFTAAATFLLLGLGGLVTSHEAGLAVPDWPTSYGYNMFLFPMRFWQCNIFFEHTHRLLASFVGLLTGILAVWLWLREPRSWLRWLGAGAFFAILLQGLLGGLRVILLKDAIGIFHATLAQCFFVLVTLIALFSSRRAGKFADSFRTTRISGSLYWLTICSASLVLIQLILGAAMRHQHAGLAGRMRGMEGTGRAGPGFLPGKVRWCVVGSYLSASGPWCCDHLEQQSRGRRYCACPMRGLKLAGRHDLQCRFDNPKTILAVAGADVRRSGPCGWQTTRWSGAGARRTT